MILGRFATVQFAQLSNEPDEVLAGYSAFRRSAAVPDFDDLMKRARALIRDHGAIRCAVGERYLHIFVDEFKDADPIQAEILFRTSDQAE